MYSSPDLKETLWKVPADGVHDSPRNVPREGPTPEQWEAVREEIRVLYLDEGKWLKDVRKILERRHGFRAT